MNPTPVCPAFVFKSRIASYDGRALRGLKSHAVYLTNAGRYAVADVRDPDLCDLISEAIPEAPYFAKLEHAHVIAQALQTGADRDWLEAQMLDALVLAALAEERGYDQLARSFHMGARELADAQQTLDAPYAVVLLEVAAGMSSLARERADVCLPAQAA